MTWNVTYLNEQGLGPAISDAKGRILGLVAYGRVRPVRLAAEIPFAMVSTPPLADEAYELWTSTRAVTCTMEGAVTAASDGRLRFGIVAFDADQPLESQAYTAYCALFDYVDSQPENILQRLWNYIPDITANVKGAERYHLFNKGRHEAFVARRSEIRQPPAASGLGTSGGKPVLYFVSAVEAGTTIENPRQVSAYQYPRDYGPRSPTFSRAMLGRPAGQSTLFVSGTASIVGHMTRHEGDVVAQTHETITNIDLLESEAEARGFAPSTPLLKVYVRRPSDLDAVRVIVNDAYPAANIMYLNADVCREPLLVEIEAIFPARSRAGSE